jgi:hypothetical protein
MENIHWRLQSKGLDRGEKGAKGIWLHSRLLSENFGVMVVLGLRRVCLRVVVDGRR